MCVSVWYTSIFDIECVLFTVNGHCFGKRGVLVQNRKPSVLFTNLSANCKCEYYDIVNVSTVFRLFIAPSSEGTMVQFREMKEFWEWIEEENIGLRKTKMGCHQILRNLNGLSHSMLGNSFNGNRQQQTT